jgi:hypothetical protein
MDKYTIKGGDKMRGATGTNVTGSARVSGSRQEDTGSVGVPSGGGKDEAITLEQWRSQQGETEIIVTGFVRNEGSLVLLSGLTEDNQGVVFACEPRYATDILEAVETGEEPVALVPDYMIIGGKV